VSLQIKNPYSIRLGVVGSGTMGSGIALAALYTNMVVTLYDISAEMLSRAKEYIEKHLARKDMLISLQHLNLTTNLEDLSGAGVVIEAAVEDLEIKKELFKRLDELCPPPTILATNTSTLPVTAIAAATCTPERVAGMHFFNPAPVLPLVEVIQGAQTSRDTLQTLVTLCEVLGKTAVIARDTPGFIVNRVARPFYGEALRLLGEQVATHEEIDRLVRMGGGFRMGPFELMDLIGIDINLAAMQSMYEQSFGEPRYRPQPIQVQKVHQGALGRKSGQGFYSYGSETQKEDPSPARTEKRSGSVQLTSGTWAPRFAEICRKTGYKLINGAASKPAQPLIGVATAGKSEGLEKLIIQMDRSLLPETPIVCQCDDVTLTEVATWIRRPERLVGFDGLFFHNGPIATLVASPTLTPKTRAIVEDFIHSLGRVSVWIQDSPGLVLPRIICMLANEAAFAVGEGVAEMDVIDKAMQLGTNYPKGPLAWAKELGYTHVTDVLDHLQFEYGEERYRIAPLLRRWARLEHVSA
jgi:3-hydroxybutyryl-CoA dehydrogenase